MNSRIVRHVVTLAALFAAAVWMVDARIAAIVVLVMIAAYLNHFYVLHSFLKAYRRQPVSRIEWSLGALGLLVSVVVILQGAWVALALIASTYVVADAIVSRFR